MVAPMPSTVALSGTCPQNTTDHNNPQELQLQRPSSTMNTPAESHLDELARLTKIVDYGDMLVVTIPGDDDLSKEEQMQIIHKAQQLQAGKSLDADRLIAALRDVTPPLDEEKEKEESIWREGEARQNLEADGCPPCYPPDVDIYSLQDTSEPCRAILSYWQSFSWTLDTPLCSQLRVWNKFRAYQKRKRARSFESFEREVRQRRQRHGLDDNVLLTMELEQQSPLDRWIEFQDYELARLEGFEKTLELEKERAEERKKLPEPPPTRKLEPDIIHPPWMDPVERAEGEIKQHMILLNWIEQERQSMLLGKSATASSNEIPAQEQGPEPEPNNADIDNSDAKSRKIAIQRRPKLLDAIKRYHNTRRFRNHSLLRRQLGLQRATQSKSRSRRLALTNPLETVPKFGRKMRSPE